MSLTLSRGPRWPNAYALAPLTNKQSDPDGSLSEDEYRWLVARAEGGFGLVMTCATYVSQAGKAWSGQLGISDDAHLPGLIRLADGLRAAGAVSSVQLHHGGRRASAEVSGVPLTAPWTDEGTGARELSTGEVHQAVQDFAVAAARAEAAGFDGVELHGAHGYLIGQFLDGRHNHRETATGARCKTARASCARCSTRRPRRHRPDFQVGLRLTPERMGIELGEFRTVAGELLATGQLDYLDVSMWDVRKEPHGDAYDGLLIDHVADLPRHGARLGVAGAISSAADAAWCRRPRRRLHPDRYRRDRPPRLRPPRRGTRRSWRPPTRSRARTSPPSPSAPPSWTTSPTSGTTSSPERLLDTYVRRPDLTGGGPEELSCDVVPSRSPRSRWWRCPARRRLPPPAGGQGRPSVVDGTTDLRLSTVSANASAPSPSGGSRSRTSASHRRPGATSSPPRLLGVDACGRTPTSSGASPPRAGPPATGLP